MKHEEFDITTATPVSGLKAFASMMTLFRKPDGDYRAKNVVVPTALLEDDFLTGF